MQVRTRANADGSESASYRCVRSCVQRKATHLDDFARDVLIARLARPDALAWLAGDDDEAQAAAGEVARLEKRVQQVEDDYDEDLIDAATRKRKLGKIAPDLDAARRRLAAAQESLDFGLLAELAGPRALENWKRMDVAQRRLALDAVALRIDVDRSTPTGKPLPELDQETVRVSFGVSASPIS